AGTYPEISNETTGVASMKILGPISSDGNAIGVKFIGRNIVATAATRTIILGNSGNSYGGDTLVTSAGRAVNLAAAITGVHITTGLRRGPSGALPSSTRLFLQAPVANSTTTLDLGD